MAQPPRTPPRTPAPTPVPAGTPPPAPAGAPARRRARAPSPAAAPGGARQRIDLALQGGGAHGAFTWGVLDRLLEDQTLEIGAISGTSAGAMNAVALAAGLMDGGRDGARAALRRLWTAVGRIAPFTPPPAAALPWAGADAWAALAPWAGPFAGPFASAWSEAASAAWAPLLGALGRSLSPYQFNPLNLNPLRGILEQTVDFERVRRCDKTALFIAATRVKTGELRIFRQDRLTADVVLASACLPLLFQAVEVDGEPYWDGGYAGNPALLPLVADRASDDLLLVQINPMRRDELPRAAGDILERVNEITFNASLLKELRQIALLRALVGGLQGQPGGGAAQGAAQDVARRLLELRLHRIDGGALLAGYGADTKTNTSPLFLEQLFALGRGAAADWLAAHRGDIGRRGSFELRA